MAELIDAKSNEYIYWNIKNDPEFPIAIGNKIQIKDADKLYTYRITDIISPYERVNNIVHYRGPTRIYAELLEQ